MTNHRGAGGGPRPTIRSTMSDEQKEKAVYESWIGIDPGQRHSGIVLLRDPFNVERFIEASVDSDNPDVIRWLRERVAILRPAVIVIEDMQATGVPCGHALLDTARWIGQFKEAAEHTAASYSGKVVMLPRNKVRMLLGAKKDPAVRQAVLAMFRKTGGGTTEQVGTKAWPGPLYGVTGHAWQAVGACMAYLAMLTMKRADDARGEMHADTQDNPFN